MKKAGGLRTSLTLSSEMKATSKSGKRAAAEAAKQAALDLESEEDERNATVSSAGYDEMDDRIEAILKFHRRNANTWDTVCKDVEKELAELDQVLVKIGIPPHNFKKDKKFPLSEYEGPPELKSCFAKDFLDYYVFPNLIPAIQALIRFATKNRVFQCRHCTFNPLDYIVEYIYNNNPNFPERASNPVPLFEIPFVQEWIARFPRKPFPKWMTMTEDEASRIIQRAVRGWLVRRREPFLSMRQKWKDQRKEAATRKLRPERDHGLLFSPYYAEVSEEAEEDAPPQTPPPLQTHSDSCLVCGRFRDFIRKQQEILFLSQQAARVPSNENDMYMFETETLVFPRRKVEESEHMGEE